MHFSKPHTIFRRSVWPYIYCAFLINYVNEVWILLNRYFQPDIILHFLFIATKSDRSLNGIKNDVKFTNAFDSLSHFGCKAPSKALQYFKVIFLPVRDATNSILDFTILCTRLCFLSVSSLCFNCITGASVENVFRLTFEAKSTWFDLLSRSVGTVLFQTTTNNNYCCGFESDWRRLVLTGFENWLCSAV